MTWGHKVTKLTSVKHKTTLLRFAHGDVYTKVKLKKFGLADSDICPRCNEPETLLHKAFSCVYTTRIWRELSQVTGKYINHNPAKGIIGAEPDETLGILTAKAEILSRILQLRDDQDYLLHPRKFVKLAIEAVARREGKIETKNELNDLLCRD